MPVQEKIIRNKEINKEIKSLKEKIYSLSQEKKINEVFIFNNCEHNWVLDHRYFQYDERPNRCTICNMVKN